MRPDRRVVGRLGLLLVILVAGFGVGRSTAQSDPTAATPTRAPMLPFGHRHDDAAEPIGGLAVSARGYTLVTDTTTFAPGVEATFAFQIVGFSGVAVREYEVVHERPMHLTVVRADLTGYQHLHPTLAPDGTWTTRLTLPAAGLWRAYADFATINASGRLITASLGINVTVGGTYRPAPMPEPATSSTVDGYNVSWLGTPRVNVSTPIELRVARANQGVVAPEPYLGAYGHLVLVREGDLGYLHTHPDNKLFNGTLKFYVIAPSAGRYRAYFDFQLGGIIRTAEFTIEIP